MGITKDYEENEILTEEQLAHKAKDAQGPLRELLDLYKDWLGDISSNELYELDDYDLHPHNFDAQTGYENIPEQQDIAKLSLSMNHFNEFVALLPAYQSQNHFDQSGIFLSKVIETLYEDGMNNFTINTQRIKTPLHGLCTNIEATALRPLHIEVNGPAGIAFGASCEYLEARVSGLAYAYAGYKTTNSTFVFEDEVHRGALYKAELCDVTFGGYAHPYCAGDAETSRFYFLGDCSWECGEEADECDFYATRIDTLNRLRAVSKCDCFFYLCDDQKNIIGDREVAHTMKE